MGVLFLLLPLHVDVINLTEDMHACGKQIIEYFTGAKSTAVSPGSDSLKSNPAKLCFVLKQCVRECAVGEWNIIIHIVCEVK